MYVAMAVRRPGVRELRVETLKVLMGYLVGKEVVRRGQVDSENGRTKGLEILL